MNDIIKQLQENEKPYCRMTSEMKCKAEKIRLATPATCDFLKLNISGVFLATANLNEFCLNSTIRLRADYKEDEYELCKIFCDSGDLCYTHEGHHAFVIVAAAKNPNFAGYLYEDNVVRPYPVVYLDACKCHSHAVGLKKLQDGNETPTRPTHVVFKK